MGTMPSLLFLNRNLVSHYFDSFLFLMIIFILLTFKTVELFHTSLMHALFWPCFSTVSRFGTVTLFLKTSIFFFYLKKIITALWYIEQKAVRLLKKNQNCRLGHLWYWYQYNVIICSYPLSWPDMTWRVQSLLLWNVLLVLWDIAVDWLLQCT